MRILAGNFNFLPKESEEFKRALELYEITHYTVFGYLLMDNIGETSEDNNIGLEYINIKKISLIDEIYVVTTYDYRLLAGKFENVKDISWISNMNYEKYIDKSLSHPYGLRNYNFDFKHKKLDPKVPLGVYIETTSGCNSSCQFCRAHEFEVVQMSDKVFNHTLEVLKRGFTREQESRLLVFPFNNNEPLLDPDIIKRCEEIRKALPLCNLMFSTNGKLLKENIIRPLLEMTDSFSLNDYKEDYDDPESLAASQLKDVAFQTGNYFKISNCPRQLNEKLFSKDRYDKWFRVKAGCIFPSIALLIGNTGEIKLCCFNNVNSRYYLGNIMDYDTLDELWNNKRFQDMRKDIQENRQLHSECRNCDANCVYPSLEVEL